MTNPTSNFNWQMPTATDLVTDLPADFEVFGQAVDTTLADLKGGTTGQVLKKNTNTDMDFVWSSDTGFANPMTTTGDTIYSSSGSTPARLGVGSTGQVLTVAGGVPSWATPSGALVSFSLLNAGGTALTGATTITVSGISGMQQLMIYVYRASTNTASDYIRLRFNADTATNYAQAGFEMDVAANSGYDNYFVDSYIQLGRMGDSAGGQIRGGLTITGCNSTGIKAYTLAAGSTGATTNQSEVSQGVYKGTSTISSVSLISSSGNFDNGTIYVYGSAN